MHIIKVKYSKYMSQRHIIDSKYYFIKQDVGPFFSSATWYFGDFIVDIFLKITIQFPFKIKKYTCLNQKLFNEHVFLTIK